MKRIAMFGILAVLSVLSGCVSVTTSVYKDDSVDFGSFKTYSWERQGHPAGNDPRINLSLIEPIVISAFDTELTRLGYTRVKEGGAFKFGYSVAIAHKAVSYGRQEKEAYLHGGFSRKGRYDWKWTVDDDSNLEYYDEGTLCLRAVDPKDKSVIWEACASMPVELSDDGRKLQKLVSKIAKKLVTELPE